MDLILSTEKTNRGKSTLVSFIKSMFYGINKNKNGQDISDIEKYKPWDGSTYSGALLFENNDKELLITREFKNNAAKMYKSDGEEISSQYNKDKSRGIDVGAEEFGIDEDTFINSIFVSQNSMKVDADAQYSIIQRISNAVQTGEEDISFEHVCHKLEKILYDEVGTDKTTTKPKYILKKDISNLEMKEQSLISNRKRHEQIIEEQTRLEGLKQKTEDELEKIKNVLEIRTRYENDVQNQKTKFDIEQETKKKTKTELQKRNQRRKISDTIIITCFTAIVVILLLYFSQYILTGVAAAVGLLLVVLNLKFMYKDSQVIENDNFDTISEEYRKKLSKEISALEKQGYPKSITEKRSSDLKQLVNKKEEEIKDCDLQLHKLKLENEMLSKDLNTLSEVCEDLYEKREEYNKVIQKEKKLELAINVLNESYSDLKEQIVPELEKDISYAVSKTTNNAYSKITMNDKSGIITRNQYGEIVKTSLLSQGTIDEIYLGFRLAISDRYSKLPIIFDESFVYFDNDRLNNVLNVLNEMSESKQIIILTCSDRECQMLDKLSIEYNKIAI